MNETYEPELKNYYIAYFDILGYKAFFEDEKNDRQKFLLDILAIVDDVKNNLEDAKKYYIEKIGIRVYSDNFLFYFEEEKQEEFADFNALSSLAALLSNIQIRVLEKYSILIRGAITKGEFFVDKDIVFGQALIRAVELESSVAVYPRIIVDKKVFPLEKVHLVIRQNIILEDNDKECYVNYFSTFNPFVQIETVRKNIIKLVNKTCKYPANYTQDKAISQRERLIAKYLWLLEKFNGTCETNKIYDDPFAYTSYSTYKINYKLKLNTRLLKIEVVCNDGKSNEK